ncbi:MAG: hypothetical protein IID54_07275 [Proteobacteria bacterium]|nr:hypothetical protein [Pseudomonadota bacterium]
MHRSRESLRHRSKGCDTPTSCWPTGTFREQWLPDDYQFNLEPHEVTPETRALAELCLILFNANEFLYVY